MTIKNDQTHGFNIKRAKPKRYFVCACNKQSHFTSQADEKVIFLLISEELFDI